MSNRTFPILSMVLATGLMIGWTVTYFRGVAQYERTIGSHWNLADKASAITAKSVLVDKFVAALEESGLAGAHNAAIFPTPDNGFDENLVALKTLQERLREIQTMDVKSFEYQTAIQQITAQETGGAKPMLDVFEGCWWKEHHPLCWEWWSLLYWIGMLALGFLGLIWFMIASDRY